MRKPSTNALSNSRWRSSPRRCDRPGRCVTEKLHLTGAGIRGIGPVFECAERCATGTPANWGLRQPHGGIPVPIPDGLGDPRTVGQQVFFTEASLTPSSSSIASAALPEKTSRDRWRHIDAASPRCGVVEGVTLADGAAATAGFFAPSSAYTEGLASGWAKPKTTLAPNPAVTGTSCGARCGLDEAGHTLLP